ncbi:MAG: hypothetical protein QG602_4137 [Verrucomicrobiota bacterium]|nr:hypothetical protein [Verrucomicrobiota bacterium]
MVCPPGFRLLLLSGLIVSGALAADPEPGPDSPEWARLAQAVEQGDPHQAKQLAATHPSLLASKFSKQSLLLLAAQEGHPELVAWLLGSGADPHLAVNATSPLAAALEWDRATLETRTRDFPELVRWQKQLVVAAGQPGKPDLSLTGQKDPARLLDDLRRYLSPLPAELVARKSRIIALLLPDGTKHIRSPDKVTDHLLGAAARNGFGAEAINRLVAAGLPVNPREPGIATPPLHAAVQAGNLPAVEALLAHGAERERLFVSSFGVMTGMSMEAGGVTPLMTAVMFEQDDVGRLLLDRGARADTANRVQAQALHLAAARGRSTLVRLLLERGARADCLDRWLCTPLNRAAAAGQLDAVKILVEARAGLELADEAGFTPLLSAMEKDRLETVEYLLQQGASLRARTDFGKGPLRVAATTNALRVARLLLARREPVEGDTPGLNTPLLEAVGSGHPPMVALLLEHGASPEARDRATRGTTIIWAIRAQPAQPTPTAAGINSSYRLTKAPTTAYLEIIRLLAANHADLDAHDRLRNTALHYAAEAGARESVELLLSLGATRDLRNDRGLTPRDLALAAGHPEVVALFVSPNPSRP